MGNNEEKIKDTFSRNLYTLMKRNDVSQSKIASITGVSQQSVSNWLLKKQIPRMGVIEKLADFFNVMKSDLLEEKESVPSFVTEIPLYSSISCGTGLFVDDHIEDYIAVPDRYIKRNKEYFANTAHGDSMIGKGIKENDVLVFEKTTAIESGEIGAFCIGESEALCKVFRRLSSGIILLESANPNYEPIEVDLERDCFRIIGKYRFKFSVEQ